MATPATLDIESLLKPIDGDNPCGESLRYDPFWDDLASARKGRRDAVASDADEEPDWPTVRDLAAEALETRSKDLQLSGWLTESLVHTHGFAGLRDGLRTLAGLVERFWEGLYPELDPDDPEIRAAPLFWLTDASAGALLPGLLRSVPLTAAGGESGEVFSLLFSQSLQPGSARPGESESDINKRKRDAQQRAEKFQAAVVASSDAFYANLKDDLAACLAEIARAGALIDSKLGAADAPSWSAIRDAVEDVSIAVGQICKTRGIGAAAAAPATADADDDAADSDEDDARPSGGRARPAGPVSTRPEAVAKLQEVASYFRKSEPHSPVAPLIERAVRWSNMPLEQILGELIQDKNSLNRIWDTLGVRAPGASKDDDDDDD